MGEVCLQLGDDGCADGERAAQDPEGVIVLAVVFPIPVWPVTFRNVARVVPTVVGLPVKGSGRVPDATVAVLRGLSRTAPAIPSVKPSPRAIITLCPGVQPMPAVAPAASKRAGT